jgi:hypothetical protein
LNNVAFAMGMVVPIMDTILVIVGIPDTAWAWLHSLVLVFLMMTITIIGGITGSEDITTTERPTGIPGSGTATTAWFTSNSTAC